LLLGARYRIALRLRLGASVAMALVMLTGCSADIAMLDRAWWSGGRSQASALSMAPAPVDDLVGPDGFCGAGPEQAPRAIGFGMTECDLVRLAGPTDRIEIGTNERGQRTATVAYVQGERAGVYRFTSGVLVSVERAPEPPSQQRQRTRRRGPS
jgi:hypothetical protein